MNVPVYVTQILYVIVFILLFCIYYALNYAYAALNYSKRQKIIAFVAVTILLFGWLVLIAVVAGTGHLQNYTALPPRILVAVIPPALAISYISVSERVNSLLKVIPPSWLITVQSFRIIMEIFLLLMFLNGAMPKQLTFEGRNFDIITGISAPIFSYLYFYKGSVQKIVILLWNAAGLLLVTNVLLIDIFSVPGPLRKFMNEPSNIIITFYPYVWIPAFIVPFAYLMHILSIKQLWKFDKS